MLGLAATKGRYWDWVPATYEQLERAEKRILQRNIRVPFVISKVAQLGTVFIPCTGKNPQSEKVRDLVLVHGFAGGNALWAAVCIYFFESIVIDYLSLIVYRIWKN